MARPGFFNPCEYEGVPDEMTALFGSNYVRDPQPDNSDLLPRDNNSTDQ